MSDKLQPDTPVRPTLVAGQETIGLTALEEFASRFVASALSDSTTRIACDMSDEYTERLIRNCIRHAQILVRVLNQLEQP